MKKLLPIIVALCVVAGVPGAVAAPSKAEIGVLVGSLYEKHRQMHEYGVAPLTVEEGKPTEDYYFTNDAPATQAMLSCMEYVTPKKQSLPSGNALSRAFGSMFAIAYAFSEYYPHSQTVNVPRMSGEFGGDVNLAMQGSEWFFDGHADGYDVRIGLMMLADKSRNIIDDQPYLFGVFVSAEETRYWLCADEEIVYQFLKGVDAESIRARNNEARTIQSWFQARVPYYSAAERDFFILGDSLMERLYGEDGSIATRSIPQFEDTMLFIPIEPEPAAYPQEDMIGMVTVVNDSSTNLRVAPDTDSRVLARVPSGTVMEGYALTDNGWYEVLFNGEAGFISSRVTELTPNARYYELHPTAPPEDGGA